MSKSDRIKQAQKLLGQERHTSMAIVKLTGLPRGEVIDLRTEYLRDKVHLEARRKATAKNVAAAEKRRKRLASERKAKARAVKVKRDVIVEKMLRYGSPGPFMYLGLDFADHKDV